MESATERRKSVVKELLAHGRGEGRRERHHTHMMMLAIDSMSPIALGFFPF